MWKPENRPLYDRSKLRYPSDVTDEEWNLIEPLIPPAKPGGNKRYVDIREIVNGAMYTGPSGMAHRDDRPGHKHAFVMFIRI